MMLHLKPQKRFVSFPTIQGASDSLGEDRSCLTTYLAAGDQKTIKATNREAFREIQKLVELGRVSAVSLIALTLPALDSEPSRLQLDSKFQAAAKHDLKKGHGHFLARAFIVPEFDDSELEFKWSGRLLALCIEFADDGDRAGSDMRELRSLKPLNGVRSRRIEKPDVDTFEAMMAKFDQAEAKMLKFARRPFRPTKSGKKHPARFQIDDGLRQFATLVPLKKVTFGHGIGQSIIKRALVGLEADIKFAKKQRGPDQLQMQHAWWQYFAANKSRRLPPLLVLA